MNKNSKDFLNGLDEINDFFGQKPVYYEECQFFVNMTYYNEIDINYCNMETLNKIINFIVRRFREHDVYADVVIIDEKRKYSTKHNRKTEEDMTTIKELIDKGLNNSDIEHITGITRKTVAKYRKRFKQYHD